jgi:hypothetical protein
MLITGGKGLRKALFAIAILYLLAALAVFAGYWPSLDALARSGVWEGEVALALGLVVALVGLAVWFAVLSGYYLRELLAGVELIAVVALFAVAALLLRNAFIAQLSLAKFLLVLALVLGSYPVLRSLARRYAHAHWLALVYPVGALYLIVMLFLRAVLADDPQLGGWGITGYVLLAATALACFWRLMRPLTHTLGPLAGEGHRLP